MKNYKLLYDENYYKDIFSQTHFADIKPGYIEIDNGYVLPCKKENGNLIWGGVSDSRNNFIPGTSLHLSDECGYKFNRKNVTKSDETVIYIGMIAFNIWGHWLTDNIKRFWFFDTDIYKKQFQNLKIVYIDTGEQSEKIKTNAYRLIQMLGLDFNNFIRIEDITSYKKIIIPDECFFVSPEHGNQYYYTDEYRKLINKIRKYKIDKYNLNYEKVYFSYARYSKARQLGEDSLERYFRDKGYKIIYPEDYTWDEQLYILRHCRYLASTIGSCSHNIIFMKKGASVILIPRAYYLTGYQEVLNELREDLNITYIDSTLSILVKNERPWEGPFFYYVSKQLLEYFGDDENEIISKKYNKSGMRQFKLYLRLGINNNIEYNCIPPEFYLEEAQKYVKSNKLNSTVFRLQRKLKIYKIISYINSRLTSRK